MNYIILISTPDSRGLVHKISSTLLDFNIEKNDEFVDKESGHFFMRTEISVESSENSTESSLRGQIVDSPEAIQSKNTNRISPDSWCKKSESKGAVVPPADFLLESELRGTPPKSEKRQLLARRGSGEGGAALLRKKSGEIGGKGIVDSAVDSAKLPFLVDWSR